MKYHEVVDKAKRTERQGFGKIKFQDCETWRMGDQINLWTYWHGYQLKDIDEKGVDILLVGQDWGNPRNNDLTGIQNIQAGIDSDYKATSPTDKMLVELFNEFGVEILKKEPGMRLFFTNYSLGYRDGPETGGMTKTIMRQDEELFNDLVLAIRPKIIICLGKITYEMVSGTIAKDFIQTLRKGTPFKAPFPLDEKIPVYGVAHCGSRGRTNIGGEENMKKLWMVIAEEFKKL